MNGAAACTTRTYAFDTNGNRVAQNASPAASDGSCTTTGGTSISRAHDAADRPTSGANAAGTYSYDQLGRQTTIPAADTPTPSRGDMSLSYYDNDTIRSSAQGALGSGGTQTIHTLDAANRRLIQSTQTDAGSTTITRHYTDTGDNPTWTTQTTGGVTATTRYNELVDGDLGLTFTTSGGTTTARLALANPRDDTAATVTLTATQNAPGADSTIGIDNFDTYTEYGAPQQAVASTPGTTTGVGYGWLGTKQRATNPTDGLTFMGARLYNPITASFSTLDPVYGGNTTSYTYPQDPINRSDLSGRYSLNKYEKQLKKDHPILTGYMLAAGDQAIKYQHQYFGKHEGEKGYGNTYNGRRADAFRHAMWMSLSYLSMSKKHKDFVKVWGDAHEKGWPDGKAEGRKDLYNNARGVAIGKRAEKIKYSRSDLVHQVLLASSHECRQDCLQIYR
jgi:RHS repeat-associated protein